MKILYITQFFYPERAAAAFRAYENAKIWYGEGHDVTVFTSYPNFPTGKLFSGYRIKLFSEESIEELRVIRSKVIIKPNTNILMRAICYLSFMFFGIWNMTFRQKKIGKDYDLVLSTSGTIFAAILGYFYSRLTEKPFVLELRDITFRQILATGNGLKDYKYKIIKWIELFLCRKAKKVITLTNGFKKELVQEGIFKNKIKVIPNGVSITEESSFNYEKNNNELIFSSFGNFGQSQDLTSIIELISKLEIEGKKIKLILIGDGSEKSKILHYKQKYNIEHLLVLDSMCQEELEKYYQLSDLCLVVLKNNQYFVDTIPSKIFQIMCRKRSILFFGPEGEASYLIKSSNSGIVLTDINKENNITRLTKLLNDMNKVGSIDKVLKIYGGNGFNFVKKYYDREELAKKYMQILKSVKENKFIPSKCFTNQ